MGFDIYGMNPVTNGHEEPQPPEIDFRAGDDIWQAYFDLKQDYYDNVPGAYFRANVWYWRPVAEFLYEHIEVLDEDDLEGLSCNSGHVINETVAKIIGKTIAEMDADGLIEEWVQNKKIVEVMKPKEDCYICEGTGVRTDNPMFGELEPYEKDGIKGLKCNGCDGEGKRAPWSSHYPYDTQKIVDFGKFASESGGFQIC